MSRSVVKALVTLQKSTCLKKEKYRMKKYRNTKQLRNIHTEKENLPVEAPTPERAHPDLGKTFRS